jgi:hypothetical protein
MNNVCNCDQENKLLFFENWNKEHYYAYSVLDISLHGSFCNIDIIPSFAAAGYNPSSIYVWPWEESNTLLVHVWRVPRSLYMLKQIKTDPKANVPLFHIWQSNHPRIGAPIRHILQAQCIVCVILVMKTTEILFSWRKITINQSINQSCFLVIIYPFCNVYLGCVLFFSLI